MAVVHGRFKEGSTVTHWPHWQRATADPFAQYAHLQRDEAGWRQYSGQGMLANYRENMSRIRLPRMYLISFY